MASQMEWSHEFCLSCDRQIAEGGTYCSQACRLADLEKAGTSDAQTSSNLSSSASSTSSSQHGFYLPPAVNFTALKTPSSSRGFDIGPSSSHYYTASNGAYYSSTQTASSSSTGSQQRSLTPSSSRSSLASAASQNPSGISAQAAQQLNSYVRSFDQARDVRRMSRRYTQY
jgi:hypothetical protein